MVVELSKAGVNTKTSSNTTTIQTTLNVSNSKELCELDGIVTSASASSLRQDKKNDSWISACLMNRNPSSFGGIIYFHEVVLFESLEIFFLTQQYEGVYIILFKFCEVQEFQAFIQYNFMETLFHRKMGGKFITHTEIP